MGLGDELDKIGANIKSGVSTVYGDVKNVVSHAGHVVESVVDTGEQIAKNTEADISKFGQSALSTITLPLLLIGAGVMFYLFNQSPTSLENTSGNIAQGVGKVPI
jgi:uncharacterized membrane protein